MQKLNGSLPYVAGIVIVAIATIGAVVFLSRDASNTQVIVTIVGFAGLLTKGFFDSAAAAGARAAIKETNRLAAETRIVVAETQAAVVETTAKVAATQQQLVEVHDKVDGKMERLIEMQGRAKFAEGKNEGAVDATVVSDRIAARLETVTDATTLRLEKRMLDLSESLANSQAQIAINTAARLAAEAAKTPANTQAATVESNAARIATLEQTPDAPLLTQEVKPSDPRYKKPEKGD